MTLALDQAERPLAIRSFQALEEGPIRSLLR
jgi:hypothetical protein